MRVEHVACGPSANESEVLAVEHLRTRLLSMPGEAKWVILSNVAFSFTHRAQSDEIDIILIGPTGVNVVEVKHWNPQWIKSNMSRVEDEADKITAKARKVGTTLRKTLKNLPAAQQSLLLTWKASEVREINETQIRGVYVYSLEGWKSLSRLDAPPVLSDDDVLRLSRELVPRSAVALEGTLTRFAGLVGLKLLTPKDERFHRVYIGSRSMQQDRVVLHLYDLSAVQEKTAEGKARREFEALHYLQQYRWAPRILDSFQEAPEYPGEMFFFSIVDPAAPSVAERAGDTTWDVMQRLAFARNALRSLSELHAIGDADSKIVHRNLTVKTVKVRHDGTPIFTGFHMARIPSDISVASMSPQAEDWEASASPEVRAGGLAAADQRSDVYALAATLRTLFQGSVSTMAFEADQILELGLVEVPVDRATLQELEQMFARLLGESVLEAPLPPARFWSEDQEVTFRDHKYRIVTKLGSGGVGTTYKVIELDRLTGEELGTYVAKAAHEKVLGEEILKAYNLARSHLGRHAGLSAIYEVAKECHENNFIALMTWIDGAPLSEFIGVFPLVADDLQEMGPEALALRWLEELCVALDKLHRNGLIHGDVSPRNIIVSEGGVVLTDYDFVSRIAVIRERSGTMKYCSPSYLTATPASASDDFYALAASLFHVVFDKEPFQYGGNLAKERGLNWEGVNRDDYPILGILLDRATHPDPNQRFRSAADALTVIHSRSKPERSSELPTAEQQGESPLDAEAIKTELAIPSGELREEHVDWFRSLLQSYPGSRWGNRETRGLDSTFANQTYVETGLEDALECAIRERRVRLVVLCGNAGDGKTALLQRLAIRFGFGEHLSSERVLEHRLGDGLTIRMNLDGSAAWRGRSSDQLLDEFLAPFQQGAPTEDIAHLLAINDGRLLEWIEIVEVQKGGNTPLTDELCAFLEKEQVPADSHIRFISLNERSLIGGVADNRNEIQADFVEQLIDRLYGDKQASEIWRPCLTCSAQDRCEAFRAMAVFGPEGVPHQVGSEVRQRARQRLIEALQTVHLRGEVHITARELRAALVFILFGTHWCDDYHNMPEASPLPYWDRAFNFHAHGRQGEVLRELARFDPALETHPQIDRYLLSESVFDSESKAPRYGSQLTPASARRRAFFEWTTENLDEVAHDPEALGLARGRHLALFRGLALDGREKETAQRAEVCARLCRGISRLEDLPPQALDRENVVPLRITPRTPTESAFWVEKPLAAFRLEADLPPMMEGLDRLHRQAWLIYKYRNGQEERLRLGAELFHLLLELSDGYQLGDTSSDDTFAHLSIFVQRIAREDEREIFAWNPMQDEAIFRITASVASDGASEIQRLVLSPGQHGALN